MFELLLPFFGTRFRYGDEYWNNKCYLFCIVSHYGIAAIMKKRSILHRCGLKGRMNRMMVNGKME